MPKKYTYLIDIMELTGLDEKQAYEKGFGTGLSLDYRSEKTIAKARSEVVAAGLLAHERWEKTGDFKYVLLHEYIRGLNHGLEKKSQDIIERKMARANTR
ncbi:MAG: hypothetical protein CVU89_02585 [Firmicutes bacterium HGW-Firmicutes-14]|nr:MAG: hypothetical protein CVU89_02585 [Firmicutes bacterium HGW-Firmicutes-14]